MCAIDYSIQFLEALNKNAVPENVDFNTDQPNQTKRKENTILIC